jgi:hypothetical protein
MIGFLLAVLLIPTPAKAGALHAGRFPFRFMS